ncbi:MAG TPA: hypothetical protein VGJ44_17735 [Kribbellaceae bacterium]
MSRATAAVALAGALACAVADAFYLGLLGGDGAGAWLLVLSWVVFGGVLAGLALARAERRPSLRRPVAVIVLAAALVQVPGLLVAPLNSSDAYRYVWDGRVQLSGISPYRMAPLDDRLAGLRDPVLFPGLGPADRTGVSGLSSDTVDDPRTRINRPRVPTIYPPVAQLWFAGIAAVTPWRLGTLGVRIAAALVAVATTALLAIALARCGRRLWLALGYGLSPAVAVEAANSGHVELLATLLVVAAAMTVRRRLLSGVLLGLAVAVKVVPLLLLPALRTGLRGRLGTATTVLASYLPHLLVTGWLVLGYLPGYLGEEGFDGGHDRYAVLSVFLPEPARAPAALLAGAAMAALAWYRTARDGAAVTATWLFGAAMLIGTPSYPWYTLPLLGLAVLAGRWEWLAVVVSAYGAYTAYDDPGRIRAWYVVAALVVLAATVWRQAPIRFPFRIFARRTAADRYVA